MGAWGWLRARRTLAASSTILTLAAGALVAAATTSPGYPIAAVSLNDGGVWVTGVRHAVLGEVNPDIRQQVMALPSFQSGAYDVLQDGGTVLLRDDDRHTLQSVDIAGRRFTGPGAALPSAAQASLAAGTVAVVDPASGALWVRSATQATGSAYAGATPDVVLGAGASAVVDAAGTVFAVSPATSDLITLAAPGSPPRRQKVTGLPPGVPVSLTVVGSTPVLLLADRHTVLIPGQDPVTLPDTSDGAVLQQPSPDGTAVLVATGHALISVPLQPGAAVTLTDRGTGSPSAPVAVGGCAYAAWSTTPTVGVGCGNALMTLRPVGSPPGARLRLRVNRGRVVLNDPDTGDTFLPDDPRVSIADWQKVTQVSDRTHAASSLRSQEQIQLADRKGVNHPPQPKPDKVAARPGATVVLPVLANDSDPDGDVLVVRSLSGLPPGSFGHAQIIDAGRAVQFTAGVTPGTQTFTYTVDDGRLNGTASSTVTLAIVPTTVNNPPVPVDARPVVSVGRDGHLSYDALQDWTDPDGDPLSLSCPGSPGGSFQCSPDGRVTYTDSGRQLGPVTVPISVSDGRAHSDGAIVVTVVADQPPLVRPDFATAVAGTPIVVQPLANDTAYGSAPLQLTRVTATDATARTAINPDGTLTVTPTTAGTIYLTYQVTAGTQTGTGLVRVDVTAPGGTHPPVTAPDSVVVRPLVPQVVDVLANDSDADGNVLVVTGVQQPSGSPLQLEVLQHRLVRVTAAASFTGPLTVGYTVSDGSTEVAGVISVRRAPDGAADASPIAKDDTGQVRAGQVTSVAVLANDSDPQGEPLTLDRQLRDVAFHPSGAATTPAVIAFTSGDLVRVVAPDAPGTVTLTYTARNASGQPASATLTLRVTPADGPNAAPVPVALQARAVAGRPTSIVVPLAGIDPDGDLVRLSAPIQQPSLGSLVPDPSRDDAYLYTPRPDAHGADRVDYQVVDPSGAVGTALIRIGVAPPSAVAGPPVAVDDTVLVNNQRPRVVQVAVLANDNSPGGDPVTLAPHDPLRVITPGAQAQVVGSTIEMTVPRGTGSSTLLASYSIAAAGVPGAAPGLLTVTARPDAPLLPPVARDDVAVTGGGSAPVTVSVLRNDSDPDGTQAELSIPAGADAVGPPDLITRVDAHTVRVVPGHNDRWAWYTVQDPDGLTARGLVFVPGSDGPPRLRPDAPPFTVTSGQTKTMTLGDYVVSPSGRPIQLGAATTISGSGVTARAASATTVSVTGQATYGPGAVTFEVIDGPSGSAAGVHHTFLTVPLTVTGSGNRAPHLRPQALTVARDATDGVRLDLEQATDDDPADAGRHSYRLLSSAAGLSVAIAGRTLSVGPGSVAAGSTEILTLQASDGRLQGSGTVTVTVTASTSPPPQASNCSPAAGSTVDPGGRFTVDVSRCAANPLAARGALTVTVSPVAGVTTSVSGETITVSLAATVKGQLAIPYTVTDALGRTASAQILASVVGLPGPPGAPTLSGTAGGSSIGLSWNPADSGGGTITRYVVRDQAAGFSQTCAGDVSQCQVSGLTPGKTYAFTVSAVNQRGEGPASAPSATLTADVPPNPPTGVVATPADGAVTVSWTGSSGTGSPIQSYTVAISPPTPDGRTQVVVPGGPGPARTTISGLTNGTGYSFSVTAKNASPQGSSQPTSSAAVIPAGPARQPPAPTVVITVSGTTAQAAVSWSPALVQAAANGSLTRLVVTDVSTAGTTTHDVTGSAAAGSTSFAVGLTGSHQVSLTVTNNLGSSATGAATTAQAAVPPAAPVLQTAHTAHYFGPNRVSLVVVLGSPGAGTMTTLTIRWEAGSQSATPPPQGNASVDMNLVIAQNSIDYNFVAEACNSTGQCSSSNTITAHGEGAPIPGAVSLFALGNLLTANWTAGNANGTLSQTSSVTITNVSTGAVIANCPVAITKAGSCTTTGTAGVNYQATYTTYNEALETASATSSVFTMPAAPATTTPPG